MNRPRRIYSWETIVLGIAIISAVSAFNIVHGQDGKRPFRVSFKEAKIAIAEPILPIDRTIRINLQHSSSMNYGLRTPDGKRLTFSTGSARTSFKINGNVVYPSNARMQNLPPGPRGKARTGRLYTWQNNGLHVTQTQEVIPGKPLGRRKAGQKRKMDVVMIKYTVENKSNRPIRFAARVRIDMYNWTTDGPAFLAPQTMPGKILDGVVLTGKQIPDYMISIQHRNVKNPGHQAFFTLNMGRKWEKPVKVIPTSHGAPEVNRWDVRAMRNLSDTDIVFYWEEKMLAPGKKREIAYAYGTSLATNPENDGKVTIAFGGSFEPNKMFSILAYVDDPVESQILTLELPDGMELLEGAATQPVPPVTTRNRSIVMWKARVLRPGTFAMRIRSSNGVTKTKTVSITRAP